MTQPGPDDQSPAQPGAPAGPAQPQGAWAPPGQPGQPYAPWGPGQPPANPAVGCGRRKWPAIGGGVVVLAALGTGGVLFADAGDPGVGDCIKTSADSFQTVDCDASDAEYQIIGKEGQQIGYDDFLADPDSCAEVDGGVYAAWCGAEGEKGTVYCAGPRRFLTECPSGDRCADPRLRHGGGTILRRRAVCRGGRGSGPGRSSARLSIRRSAVRRPCRAGPRACRPTGAPFPVEGEPPCGTW